MELKGYQKRVLGNLREYLRRYVACGSAAGAYAGLLAEDGLAAGTDGVAAYTDDLGGVPKVCVKVPTGGGKTFIAANALAVIADELPPAPADVVVWLVPRKEILRQTYRQLADPGNPLRRTIDAGFAHCVEVLSKEDGLVGRGFTRASVEDQLTLFVLSYDSFKNKDGRRAYAENSALAQLTDHQRASGQAVDVAGADDTALISALAGTSPIVVVDESHHAKSALSVEMLRNLNPRFVLELTATPRRGSNVICRVKASELKAEQMVKLPVIVYRRQSKLDVIQDAFLLQRRLEAAAVAAEERGGRYIRPIVLLQAERRGADDAETYGRLKAKLVEAGIPAEQIAVRTGDVDELGDADLMSRSCPIRYVITVEALAEGWDCPFAYVLATVANKSSKVSVEQLVGRILRQPHAERSAVRALNISYVLTSSADFTETVDQVVAGLNDAGFSRRDLVEGQAVPSADAPVASADRLFGGGDGGSDGSDDADDDLAGMEFDFSLQATGGAAPAPVGAAATPAPSDGVDKIIRDAEAIEGDFEQRVAEAHQTAASSKTGVGEGANEFRIRASAEQSVEGLLVPQFACEVDAGLFGCGERMLFERESLLSDFNLAASAMTARFDATGANTVRQVDVEDETGNVHVRALAAGEADELRSLFSHYAPETKREAMTTGIVGLMPSGFQGTYGVRGLLAYTRRAVDSMSDEQVDAYVDNAVSYARAVMDAVRAQADDWRRAKFRKMLDAGAIVLEPRYSFPRAFVQKSPLTTLDRTLYVAEDKGNGLNRLEAQMADALANCRNILWWHRVVERKEGEFCINGFINHYPDFLAMTCGGKLLAIETKGEQLKNEDSRSKLALGRLWAQLAGPEYRYFMVFETDATGFDGAYTLAEFKTEILKEIQ